MQESRTSRLAESCDDIMLHIYISLHSSWTSKQSRIAVDFVGIGIGVGIGVGVCVFARIGSVVVGKNWWCSRKCI